jgi:hypothetical protein
VGNLLIRHIQPHKIQTQYPHLQRLRHWFSLMGTFLPFEIITYAI